MQLDPRYPGDAYFRELLIRAGNPFTVEEARAAIAGAILATEVVQPSTVLSILCMDHEESKQPKIENLDEAKNLFGALMGLWNEMTQHQDPNHPFRFSPLPKNIDPKNAEHLLKVASLRAMEISMFLSALAEGGTLFGDEDESEFIEDDKDSLPLSLDMGMSLLQEYSNEIKSGKYTELPTVIPLIEAMDERMLKLYPKFISETKAARLAYLAAYDEDEFDDGELPHVNLGPKIGRNEPCPCGSGTKYKRCCLQ